MTTVAPLAPEVIDRLRILQKQDRPISVDEILVAANLNHLTQQQQQQKQQQQQQQSKSTSTAAKKPSSLMVIDNLEKSVSTSTLAERRRLPLNPEKLKLYSQITSTNTTQQDSQVLKRLEEQNAKLPTQVSSVSLFGFLYLIFFILVL
jgi:hypothetical protein